MARATVRSTNEKLRGLAAKGLSQAEAARKLGLSRQRVSQIAARLGLTFGRRVPPIPVEQLNALAKKGLTKKEAARRLGVSSERVSKLAAELGIPFALAWSRPQAPATKLGRVVQAARLACGYSYPRLAEVSGLHRCHSRAIERGWVRRPTEKTLRALAGCLAGHTSYEELANAAPAVRPPLSEERLEELAKKGLRQKEAAKELGVSQRHVSKLASRFGISFAKAWRKPKAPTTEFGRVLQAARLDSGYSYRRLAALSGLSRWYVTGLELGRVRRPGEKPLRALADCLDGHASYDDLVRAVQRAEVPAHARAPTDAV